MNVRFIVLLHVDQVLLCFVECRRASVHARSQANKKKEKDIKMEHVPCDGDMKLYLLHWHGNYDVSNSQCSWSSILALTSHLPLDCK